MSDSGQPVSFYVRQAPDHLAHFDTEQANHLIGYMLHEAQPERYPARATLRAFGAVLLAVLAVIAALRGIDSTEPALVVLCAMVAGWFLRSGYVEWLGARHGRANDHITAIIAEYERRLTTDGER